MKFVLIVGPPAVGKMTVGQELAKITGLRLFHNHMSLELVNRFFDFGTPNFRNLDRNIRFAIFKEIADSDLDGIIFTLVWAFDEPEDETYVDEIIAVFQKRKPQVCIVELKASLEERLKRNRHPNRLKHKPSKRDVDASEKRLLYHDQTYRMNTNDGELPHKNIYTIDNTDLSPAEVAQIIKTKFSL